MKKVLKIVGIIAAIAAAAAAMTLLSGTEKLPCRKYWFRKLTVQRSICRWQINFEYRVQPLKALYAGRKIKEFCPVKKFFARSLGKSEKTLSRRL